MICLEGPSPARSSARSTEVEATPACYRPCAFYVKWAWSDWESEQAMALRRAVFCSEQGIFLGDDRDAIDAQAQLLVAVSVLGGAPDAVVGTVRIHQAASGLWWGSRLAVHPCFRHFGHIGSTLIRLAVGSAHARGCRSFLAHVQRQNVPLFERLHWNRLHPVIVHGRAHCLMQADLASYPPCADPYAGFVACAAEARR